MKIQYIIAISKFANLKNEFMSLFTQGSSDSYE